MSDVNKGLCVMALLVAGGMVVLERIYTKKMNAKDKIIEDLAIENQMLKQDSEFYSDMYRDTTEKVRYVIHAIDPVTEEITERAIAVYDDHRKALEHIRKLSEFFENTNVDLGFMIEAI